jgi:hypothetical protein
MLISLQSSSQTNNPNEYPEKPSHSQQASDYLHNIEKNPNGVPDNAVWYAQPWIWAIVAAILVLIIGLIYKNNTKRDDEVEPGLRTNKTV